MLPGLHLDMPRHAGCRRDYSRLGNIQWQISRIGLTLFEAAGILLTQLIFLDLAHGIPGQLIHDEDLPALYRASDLFVYPSLYEGFGLPLLEAMACGTPVVTSNVSSLPEVVGDAGITVDPTDIHALADAMSQALQDTRLRRQMIDRGRARAAEFTWLRAARQLRQVYQQLTTQV